MIRVTRYVWATPIMSGSRFFSAICGTGDKNTIFALASGGVRCALAVIRVSGPQTVSVIEKIGRFPSKRYKFPKPREATLRKFYDPSSNGVIDNGLLLWFPGPKSFTGEDSCEFHVHGGPAVVSSLLRAIGSIPGCRMGEPGEFSRRAFFNGKMDLTAVEGLGDLIAAETEMQRTQALHQVSGSLGSLYTQWRNTIAKCLATVEAYIDFGEDDNIEGTHLDTVETEVRGVISDITTHLRDHNRGERLRNGVRIAILGKPNVGKSSLLNILSRRDVAIVSNSPGTTRDVVTSALDFKGYPVVFLDTAGIRLSKDEIEKEGIRRAVQEAIKADIIIAVISYPESQEMLSAAQHTSSPLNVFHQELIKMLLPEKGFEDEIKEFAQKILFVLNKVDLTVNENERLRNNEIFDACISCKTSAGLETFTKVLTNKIASMCAEPKFESPCLTRERHRHHLHSCIGHLEEYLNSCDQPDMALRAYPLRRAVDSIGYITGHLCTEDILDIVFSEFCIGK